MVVYEKFFSYIIKSTGNVEIFASNFLVYIYRYYKGDPSYIETFQHLFLILGTDSF